MQDTLLELSLRLSPISTAVSTLRCSHVDLLQSVRSLGDIGSCSMLLFRSVLSQRCLCFAPMLCVALSINIYHFEVHFCIHIIKFQDMFT